MFFCVELWSIPISIIESLSEVLPLPELPWPLSAYFITGGSWEVGAEVMQVLGCLTGSWAPAGKVTVSCMLGKCLPIASQECFGMFLPSLSAIPFCKSLGSSLPVFSCCVHMLLLGLTVSPPSRRHCLTQSIWGEQADSSLLPGCTFLYTKAEHAAYAINPKQMNQIVLQPVRGYKIFEWAVCRRISKLDTCFGSSMLRCQSPQQPSSGRLCYIENNFSIQFLLAVEIFEQTSREQRPCWQFWFTGCTAAGRGMLKSLLAKIRCSTLKKDVSVTLHRRESIWLASVNNRCIGKHGFPSE